MTTIGGAGVSPAQADQVTLEQAWSNSFLI